MEIGVDLSSTNQRHSDKKGCAFFFQNIFLLKKQGASQKGDI